jgi:ATP-dependent DNA helicase RecQ
VVVSPLKALMAEQVSSLLRRKIPYSYINSDIDPDEKSLRYRLLANNDLKLLYVAQSGSLFRALTSNSNSGRFVPHF